MDYWETMHCNIFLSFYRYEVYVEKLRVDLCKLNFHNFRRNFRDAIDAMCLTDDGVEDTEHYLLLCKLMRNLDASFSMVSTQFCLLVTFLTSKVNC